MSRLGMALSLLGGFAAGMTWSWHARIQSAAVRLLSGQRPNAARHAGIRVDLGLPVGDWTRPVLAASLSRTLSEVVGRPMEGAAYSRFGDFEGRRPYSRFLDPESAYYQAWLGAYVILDGPEGAFGVGADGAPRPEDALAALEADQRLVYRSSGCPHRFDDGRCTRLVGPLDVQGPDAAGRWRLKGEAETWSSYCAGGAGADPWGRALYGVVPQAEDHGVDDYHPLRYQGEFWLRHDDALGVTCCSFLIVPRFVDRAGRERFPGERVLASADDRLQMVRFHRA